MQTVERKKKPSLDPVFTQVEWELLSTLEISRVLEEFLDLQALAAVTEARDRARDSVAVRASLSTFRPAPMASVLLTLLARLQTSILSLLALTGRQKETVTYAIAFGHIILVSVYTQRLRCGCGVNDVAASGCSIQGVRE